MRRRSNRVKGDLSWDGLAEWWPRPYHAGPPGGDSNLWMCAQDLGLELWAQFHRLERRDGRHKVGPVRLETCSPELADILVDSLPYNEHREDLSGAVVNFAKMVAQQLILDGAMVFEVQAGWDRSGEQPRLEQARMLSIPNGSIVRLGGFILQVVPPKATESEASGRIIRLDSSRVVAFKPPARFRRALHRIRAALPLIGHSEHEWMMAVGQQPVPEEFKAVVGAYAVQRARVTAPIGWNARGLYREYIAGFHSVSRELHWKRFCIEARDRILGTLRDVFSLIGACRGEQPRLVWDQLPTVEQVEESESRLVGPGVRFDVVLAPFGLG